MRQRVLARVYDYLILNLIVLICLYLFNVNSDFPLERNGYWSVYYVSYYVLIPLLWSGYVIGKKFSNIRLTHTGGEEPMFKHTFLREFVGFYLLGILTLGGSLIASMIMMAVREDGRGIHDFIGGTRVVNTEGH
ncbi:RDD family protein [Alkalibacillus almallahensis]|uniref:RDD family protein n=1 Tax=Alkalibacillus almallahensis TaxID=1379154 RepID=UPI001FBB1849|nr:RDD family protein [Alkalibacillus almallahensis]NIK12585.1 putative RDD family membrane protein YckC [Alkalibacillus almallahensis]